MAITKEQLLEFGMKEDKDNPIIPFSKIISLPREKDDDSGLGEMEICITTENNTPELILSLPDGAKLYLACQTIEELKTFESFILIYEPNF